MSKSTLQLQLTYAAVKRREVIGVGVAPGFSLSERKRYGKTGYLWDVWTWNVFKLKWTRMANHGSGFTSLAAASETAQVMNNATRLMLAANREPPPAIGTKRATRN